MAIPRERALELTRGAEVLDLTEPGSGPACGAAGIPDLLKILSSSRNGNGEKRPTWDIVKTEVVENPQSLPEEMKEAGEAKNPPERDSREGRGKSPPLVKHASNLTTSKTPKVPGEERDPPNSRKVREEVMSRDGYYCRNTGCPIIELIGRGPFS